MTTSRLRFSAAHAYRSLREADPVVARLIDQHGPYLPRPRGEPWGSLVRSILFQQLAGTAAMAIQRRLYALHGDTEHVPTPEQLLATTDEQFSAAGVSRQKAAYLRDLAAHASDGRLDFASLDALGDEAVIEALTAVHGRRQVDGAHVLDVRAREAGRAPDGRPRRAHRDEEGVRPR